MAKELKYRIKIIGIGAAVGTLTFFARRAGEIFRGIGRVMRGVFRFGLLGLGTLGGLGVLLSPVAAIKAASGYEQLKIRLEAVIGSGEKAKKIFKDLRDFSAKAPIFKFEDLVKAKIVLQSLGLVGEKAFESVADAAAGMQKPVEEVALLLASMSGESLKRMGIELRKTGDQFTFTFRDKAGAEITKVIDGINEAREGLVDIFSGKFGGGVERAGATLAGVFASFKSKMQEALAMVGYQMLPTIKRGFAFINEQLDTLTGSGLLKTPQGLLTLFSGMGAIIVGAFTDGADIVYDKIVGALKANIGPRTFVKLSDGKEKPVTWSQMSKKQKDRWNRLFGTNYDTEPSAALKTVQNKEAPHGLKDALAKMARNIEIATQRATIDEIKSLPLEIDNLRKTVAREVTGSGRGARLGLPGFGGGGVPVMAHGGGLGLPGFGGGGNKVPGGMNFRSPKARMLEGLGAALGGGSFQGMSLSQMVDRARGQSPTRIEPGTSPSAPLFVEEVKPQKPGLV